MLLLYFLNSSYNHFDMVTLYLSLCSYLKVHKRMYNCSWSLADKMEDVPQSSKIDEEKITKNRWRTSWKRRSCGDHFEQTVLNMEKLSKKHFPNGVLYPWAWAIFEISQPTWRNSGPNRGVFSAFCCGQFGVLGTNQSFRDWILSFPLYCTAIYLTSEVW